MKLDKEVRSLYRMTEEKLENKKDELYNEFLNASETHKKHIGYEIGLVDGGLDRLYEAQDLWASDLSDNDDTFNIIKDIHHTYFGHPTI